MSEGNLSGPLTGRYEHVNRAGFNLPPVPDEEEAPVPRTLHLEIHHLKRSYGGIRAAELRAEERLLVSIANDGQRVPIVVASVSDGRHEIIDGFRRIRALVKLEEEVVSAIEWPTSAVDALVTLRRVEPRSSSRVLEEGWLVETLVEQHKMSLAEVARRLGHSKTWAHSRLSLVRQLPDAVCQRVLSGELSGTVAWRLAVPFARANGELVEAFCQCVIDHGLSARQAELVYQNVMRMPNTKLQREILERPERVLTLEGVGDSKGKGKVGDVGLDASERLERWCRQGLALKSVLSQLTETGASEDALGRVAQVWRKRSGVAREVTRRLDELAELGQRLVPGEVQRC